jgi:aminopeptidase N
LDPVNEVGDAVFSDMAYYSVQVSLPREFYLAATGVELGREEAGERVVYEYASGPAREFFIAASPRFISVQGTANGVKVNVVYMAESKDAGTGVLEIGEDSLRVFEELFGEYAYTELDILQAPMENAAGVEFSGIVLIEAERFKDPSHPVLKTVVAHEVAHQWWYNSVGNNAYAEPWLDEALTTYSSTLYWEAVMGSSAYAQVIADFQARYQTAAEAGATGRISQGIDFYSQPEHARTYAAIVYYQGALFFDALRSEIGDQAFFAALQNYYRDYQYQIAYPDDLLASFEKTAGRSLDRFYQEWLSLEE